MRSLLISVPLVLLILGCSETAEVTKTVIKPVKIIKVQRSSDIVNLTSPGTVRASKRAEISFDVPGRIIMIDAIEGATINKGDIIAKLDDSDYQNNHQSAKASLKEAKATFERYQDLIKNKSITKANLDTAEKFYNIASANMKVAQKALNDTKLKAYFSGTIASRHVENFQNIQAKQPIVSIEDKSALEVVVNVSEVSLASTNQEDIVSIHASFSAIPGKEFPLEIKEISEKIDPATRSYAIVLSMAPTKGYNLLSGMTASVRMRAHSGGKDSQEQVRIPTSAIMGDKDNNTYAWIYSSETGSVSKRRITIGEMSGESIHVLSGLEFGESIVTAGVNYLVQGMQVKPLTGKVGEAL